MIENAEVIVRPFNAEKDQPYIYSTWSKYSWYSPRQPIHISKAKFFKEKHEQIKSILQGSSINIACLKDDPYVIIGYIVVRDKKIEWICVKKPFHGYAIDDMLIRSMKGLLNE